ncbi:hypothetical protein [Ilumatobacter sp.]|uniref:hypothetical protein n=1 Tax=Ilumatobacter sp. TaxID=1967498 RepID=UPI003750D316
MNRLSLQQWVDEFLATSRQQWLLRLVVVVAPVGAVLAAAAATGAWWPFGLLMVTVLATVSAIRPDTHTALGVVVLIVWHWSARVDAVDTPWLPLVGICLLVFHSVVALLATIPTGGEVPNATLGSWLRRTALGGGAALGMWALVVVFDRGDAAGNGVLTALALAVVVGAAVLVRSRSVDQMQ